MLIKNYVTKAEKTILKAAVSSYYIIFDRDYKLTEKTY